MALLLGKYVNVLSSFWTGLQADYVAEEARTTIADKLRKVKPFDYERVVTVIDYQFLLDSLPNYRTGD